MICLVRHGQTDWNYLGKIQGMTDVPLNDVGRRQAEECREYVNSQDWDFIISSPLKRAKETAEIINKDLNLQIIEMEEFKERSFGIAEGLTLEERTIQFPEGDYPGQESKQDLVERVMSGIDTINRSYPGKKVLLVAHGAVIGTLLSTISNGQIGSGRTKLMNACISNIQHVDDQWKIHNYNQIDHLTM
ncbi:histidine phosphatase family protein [Aquibacillus halophilus]|uniref:Histidine phosphatase family protein n=1 Tax=Aquibacillus halophilus TaxID=930132 RepID=A0A6A8DUV0_9BACI|nr:histidine phosphatase family protein [Aquibacillus halophilus]MRH44972.1 histidine phosphatase family protein [Aquibacillus halophilus]